MISAEIRNPSEEAVQRVALYSLLFNLGLVGAKLFLSAMTGSLSLRADAVHSVVDVLASVALILGIFISRRKRSDFPYGLYKVENVVSVGISLLLFLTAYEIALQAYSGESMIVYQNHWTLLAVAALIPFPFLFGSYQVKVGRALNSPSLIADGVQHKADVLTSTLVFLGFLGYRSGLPLDRIAAGIICLFILWEGWGILVDGMRVLLDASVDRKTLEEMHALIEDEPEVISLKEVTARNSGQYLFMEAAVELRVTDLKKAHLVSLRIEEKIRQALPHVDRVLISFEPRIQKYVRYVVPLANSEGSLSKHFGESPYFALIDINREPKALSRQEILVNPHSTDAKGKGLKVARLLLKFKPDVVMTVESLEGKGPGYALAEAGVETIQIEPGTLTALVDHLIQGNGSNDRDGSGSA